MAPAIVDFLQAIDKTEGQVRVDHEFQDELGQPSFVTFGWGTGQVAATVKLSMDPCRHPTGLLFRSRSLYIVAGIISDDFSKCAFASYEKRAAFEFRGVFGVVYQDKHDETFD
jgi:hypothetical protein